MAIWRANEIIKNRGNFPSGLSLQDISIIPGFSIMDSSDDEINISQTIRKRIISSPFWVAPMKGVSNLKVAEFGIIHGVPVVLPSSENVQFNVESIKRLSLLKKEVSSESPICISFNPNTKLDDFEKYLGLGLDFLVCDCAYAPSKKMIKYVSNVMKNSEAEIIFGNLLTLEAAKPFIESGIEYFKIGYGWGSICTSTLMTGIGRSQIDTILEFAEYNLSASKKINFIVDGGIKYPGDIVKALGLGASGIMSGHLFSGTNEATTFEVDGMRIYEGSYYNALESVVAACDKKEFRVEGLSLKVASKGSVQNVFAMLTTCVKLGMKMIGVNNITDLKSHLSFCIQQASNDIQSNSIYKSNYWLK